VENSRSVFGVGTDQLKPIVPVTFWSVVIVTVSVVVILPRNVCAFNSVWFALSKSWTANVSTRGVMIGRTGDDVWALTDAA
jgi:hypothetical protein